MLLTYFKKLYAYIENHEEFSENFPALQEFSGATDTDMTQLKQVYPECPQLLIDLLKKVDGTYGRKTTQGDAAVPILASIDYSYPHYLLSIKQIIADATDTDSIAKRYEGYEDYVELDSRIDKTIPFGKRFSLLTRKFLLKITITL